MIDHISRLPSQLRPNAGRVVSALRSSDYESFEDILGIILQIRSTFSEGSVEASETDKFIDALEVHSTFLIEGDSKSPINKKILATLEARATESRQQIQKRIVALSNNNDLEEWL